MKKKVLHSTYGYPDIPPLNSRECCLKFATGLNCLNRHRSKNIWVTRLFFCQNDYLMGESLWQKDSLVTLILFELCLFWYLAQSQILGNSLYDEYMKNRVEILFLGSNYTNQPLKVANISIKNLFIFSVHSYCRTLCSMGPRNSKRQNCGWSSPFGC